MPSYRVLTIAATPLTLAFYSPHHRPANKAAASLGAPPPVSDKDKDKGGLALATRNRFTVVLDQLESFGAVMVLTHLLASSIATLPPPPPPTKARLTLPDSSTATQATDSTPRTQETLVVPPVSKSATATPDLSRSGSVARHGPASSTEPLTLIPLRLVELTERGSDVMLASAEAASHLARDALVALYRTFASLSAPSARVERGDFAMTAADNWPETVARCAVETESDMVLVPWRIGGAGNDVPEMGNVVEAFSAFCHPVPLIGCFQSS